MAAIGAFSPWWASLVTSAALVVLAVGRSETAMGMVVGTLAPATAAAALVCRSPRSRVVLKTLALGVLIALLASAVVVAAPGNALRAGYFQHLPLLLALVEAAWYPFLVIATLLVHAPAYAVIAHSVPFWAARQFGSLDVLADRAWCRATRRAIMLTSFLALAGAPAFYIGSAAPPPRALVVLQALVVATLVGCGWLNGRSRRTAPRSPRYAGLAKRAMVLRGPRHSRAGPC